MKTKKSECNGCNNFEYDNSCRSQFKCATDGRSFFTLNTPDWCPGREENNKMNVMESKICERCGDYFSRKIGSEVEECLDCKNKMESAKVERLPTKKEVTERLQNAIDVINNGGCFLYVKVHKSNSRMACYNNGEQIGHSIKYRPEPKPPERLAAVLVRTSGNCMPRVSAGRFDQDGKLLVFDCQGVLLQPDSWGCWYCPSTGEHSDGWRDEWTPEEFRK